MDPDHETWVVVDERTDKEVSVTCYFTEAQAQRQIDAWTARDARGGRPDCHYRIGHMVPKRTR